MSGAPPLGRSRLLRLADGRALAWAEWGDPKGDPVIEFHGNPGCRLLAWGGDEIIARAGVRLISFDRAGIGGSDPSPRRTVAAAAADVIELAGALGLERFSALGYSVGGAYAAACAAAAPGRLSALALISSVVPLGELGELDELGHELHWRLAARSPRLLAAAYRTVAALSTRSPSITGRIMAAGLSPPDRAIAVRPEVRRRALGTASEVGRQGGRGVVEDMRAVMRPWGFRLDQVSCPTTVWQGDEDGSIPAVWGERLAAAIPGASLRLLPGEGHYLIEGRLGEILSALGE